MAKSGAPTSPAQVDVVGLVRARTAIEAVASARIQQIVDDVALYGAAATLPTFPPGRGVAEATVAARTRLNDLVRFS